VRSGRTTSALAPNLECTPINLIASLLLTFGGSGLFQILFVAIDAVIIYLFLTDPRIKAELGAA
jgi:hypothetical protein